MTMSYIFILVFIMYALGDETYQGAEEVFTTTNFLLANGIISICSRLDDLKRK